MKVSPKGQKVCLVEGKMSLTKLSCQKVTTGSGISVQLSPSCDDLSFLIGIQGCSTQDKTLFTVTVKANSSGIATASFSGVDIIGEGVSISSAFSNGIYTLTAPEKKITYEPKDEVISTEEVTLEEEIILGEEEVIAEEHEEEILSEESEEESEEETSEEEIAPEGLLAAIGIMPFSWKSFLIIIVIIAAGLIAFQLIRRKRAKRLSE